MYHYYYLTKLLITRINRSLTLIVYKQVILTCCLKHTWLITETCYWEDLYKYKYFLLEIIYLFGLLTYYLYTQIINVCNFVLLPTHWFINTPLLEPSFIFLHSWWEFEPMAALTTLRRCVYVSTYSQLFSDALSCCKRY